MRFPSKATPYKDSSIAKFPSVLSLLSKTDMSPNEMYSKLSKSKVRDIGEFVDILDCLYAMGKLEIREGLLHYAD